MKCFIRAACSIEFDDKVVVTGGWGDGWGIKRVTVYDVHGFVEFLPNMIHGRKDHGCGHYINNNNEIVKFILFTNFSNIVMNLTRCTL